MGAVRCRLSRDSRRWVGEDTDMGPEKWEYAGDADTKTWHTWKDHKLEDKSSGDFHYRDETPESISKDRKFPENGYQENPEKM